MDRAEFARSVHDWIVSARPADRTIAGEITAAIVADADQYAAHLIERYAHPDYSWTRKPAGGDDLAEVMEMPDGAS